MLFKGNLFHVRLYCVLFICPYYATKASTLKKGLGVVDDVQIGLFKPEEYVDENIVEPDYFYDDPCFYDCGEVEKKNNKRQIVTADGKTADFPRSWPENFYKYHNYLKNLEKNKKSERLISKSWSAGGMPFNVLYTPNSHQQKILRSAPEKMSVAPVNVFPLIGEPMALSAPSPPPPSPYDAIREEINAKKQYQKLWSRSSQRPSSRRRYSIIPQLFVSYGWGPTGK